MTRAELSRGLGVLSTVLCLMAAGAMSSVAYAQSTNRPQLVVQRAEADLAAETLLITGEKLLWNNDSAIVVTLAGTPLAVLGATDSYVLAQLPPGLAPGSYLLKVSRGTGTVQNDAFDLTVGVVGPAGPTGPKGEMGDTGPDGLPGATGPAGPTGPAGRNGFDGPPGPAGPTGSSGPTGPKGLNARGAWSAATNYVQDDVVTEAGQTWRCQITDCVVGNLPASTNPEWELLAARGADGATGAAGPQGPTGPTGPQGTQGPTGATGAQGPTGATLPHAHLYSDVDQTTQDIFGFEVQECMASGSGCCSVATCHASCPESTAVTGGGFWVHNNCASPPCSFAEGNYLEATASFPESNGWTVEIANQAGRRFKAYALCRGSRTFEVTNYRTTSTSP
jgi:hypothetical protein